MKITKPKITRGKVRLIITFVDGVMTDAKWKEIKDRKIKRSSDGRFAASKEKRLNKSKGVFLEPDAQFVCPVCGANLQFETQAL